MSDLTEYDVTEAMIVYGGSFVSTLGCLIRRADDINRRRLLKAFPEYWEQYEELAALHLRRGVTREGRQEETED